MSLPFLKQVALHIHEHYKDNAEKLCIVLPGKRGALFLKHHLSDVYGKTIWLPEIISTEELINSISELNIPEEIDQICKLYESYCHCYGDKAEPFESFAKWGQLMLQDFNEIDRHLADPVQLYENLAEIKEIENWSLSGEELTEFQKNYLAFMHSLSGIYKKFTENLIKEGLATQGLSYRKACEKIENTHFADPFNKILFCGFNALNAAEIRIFSYFQKSGKAEIFWDGDPYYIKNEEHEAGLFLRKNLKIFAQKDPLFFSEHFKEKKQIDIYSVPKQIGQALAVKQKVQEYIDRNVPLDKVAIVLANEKLLWPVLRMLPEEVKHINITMEYPLKFTSTYALLNSFIHLQINYSKQEKKNKHIYHQDLISLLRQPLFSALIRARKNQTDIGDILRKIQQRNIAFIGATQLREFFGSGDELIDRLIYPSENNLTLCRTLHQVLSDLQKYFAEQEWTDESVLETEYISILIRCMNRMQKTLETYTYFHDIKAFKQLFSQSAGTSSAPFIGEPLQGLQLMGVLETRTLDFEHLILVNVNESVLPSGKSVNSFIPNDLKRAFGLPLFTDKDAIYSYHFYRLLQRAKEITITYDSETDTFGKGEKSRFISQLQLELKAYCPATEIHEFTADAAGKLNIVKSPIQIAKTDLTLIKINEKAFRSDVYSGLSPSALDTFKDCSLKFYFRYGAGLKETGTVEENAESNTFGSILHLSLEELYKDLIGLSLTKHDLEKKKKKVHETVNSSFLKFFETKEIKGKNLIQAEVINAYVDRQIKKDIEFCEKNSLTLKELEKEFNCSIGVEIDGEIKEVFIKGKIDRVDTDGKKVRIVDYKNSVHKNDVFEFNGMDPLFYDPDYKKQFQLFMYAWMINRNGYCKAEDLRPCIMPFRKAKNDIEYLLQDKSILTFTNELLQEFEGELTKYIQKIFDRKTQFEQTSDESICQYCEYLPICLKDLKKAK